MTAKNTSKNSKTEAEAPAALTALRPSRPGGDSMVLATDYGSTIVAEDVVATLAGLAIREVEGVEALVPRNTTQRITSLASTIAGREQRDLGVSVRIGKLECAVECRVVIRYGQSIPNVAAAIRENVTERVQTGTGLIVKRVDIEVVDLYFDEDHRPPAAPSGAIELN